jgi:hypothetical protein
MLDLLYDLSPDEDISLVGGHLLVVITDDTPLSTAVADHMENQIARLDDSSEFLIATRSAAMFPQLKQKAQDIPALFHFLDGKLRAVCHGVDDCVEFFEEFVIANRCKRNNVKRY